MGAIGKSNGRERIGSDYIIQEKLGSGGQANVFLVTKIGGSKKYAAKVFKKDDDSIDIEINILNKFKQNKNPYIINIIETGKGEIVRNKREKKISKYFIMENYPNGNIFDYIYYRKSGLGELLSKILFQKILKGLQYCHENNVYHSCHENNVYHRDIKLENILLDDKYNPIICDFGLASLEPFDYFDCGGTKEYKPPEINGENKYDCLKVDIFYLGSALMLLTTGLPGFLMPDKDDYFFLKLLKKIKIHIGKK